MNPLSECFSVEQQTLNPYWPGSTFSYVSVALRHLAENMMRTPDLPRERLYRVVLQYGVSAMVFRKPPTTSVWHY